jgi:carboxylate-amine ligase
LREVLTRGTSAHRQLHAYKLAREDGADEDEALKAVVDQLV